jgi:hypothetical protein
MGRVQGVKRTGRWWAPPHASLWPRSSAALPLTLPSPR